MCRASVEDLGDYTAVIFCSVVAGHEKIGFLVNYLVNILENLAIKRLKFVSVPSDALCFEMQAGHTSWHCLHLQTQGLGRNLGAETIPDTLM